jgi:ubiquinone/menaquinone biosynthesis C-methylase UbiE
MNRRLAERMKGISFPIELVPADGQRLDFANDSFDTVVVSLVLCTVPNPSDMLAEMFRVLRPGGQYLFFEHVASEDPKHRRWQDRLNPLQRLIGCGCNLNRETANLIEQAGFVIDREDRHITSEVPFNPELFPFISGRAVKE